TGSGGTTDLPTPNVTGTISMAAGAGKVALLNTNTLITSGTSCPSAAQVVDFVGFGGANCFEGSGPTAVLGNSTSAQRKPIGFDSNNNSSDFEVLNLPTPMTSAGVVDATAPQISTLFPTDNSTNTPPSFTATITFNETVQKGTGSIALKRTSDNVTLQTIDVTSTTLSGNTVTFDISSLAFNTGYYFEITSGSFKDLANNDFAGITGNGTWNFTTVATASTGTIGTTYSFATCGSNFPDGFTQYSVTGEQKWACTTFGKDAASSPTGSAPNGVQINGFANGTNVPNQDWFISPSFDLSGTIYPLLSFWSRTAFNGDPLQLKISTDYSGTGDPRLATWTDLNGRFPNQTSDVWTLSNNINLSAYKASKVFIAFVYNSSEDDGARWTLDDIKIENSATPPPPSLTVGTTDIQFTFVANGSTGDKTFSLIGNDLTAGITLTTNGNFLLSKDGNTFSNSITYSLGEANNLTKTVTVRFVPTQKNQNYTGTITITTSGLTSSIALKGSSIDPAGTLEVVNWNIEWFGSPSNGPTNDAQQEQNVKTVLQNVGADIYGLVEVVNEPALARVVSQLPGYSYVVGQFGSHATSPATLGEAQKLAFVYKTSLFSNVSVRPLINNQNTSSVSYNNWSSGRYPFLMTADVTLNCVTKRMNFVLIHAKANTSPTATSYARRQAAAQELHDTLETYFADANIIIMGDFNDDLDKSITAGFTTTSYSSFTTDPDFFSPTLALSLDDKKSTVSYNDVIDHVILSNELQPYYMTNTATVLTEVSTLVSNYGSTTSDHYPVFTRYQFEQPAAPTVTSCPTVTPFCINSNNTYTIPAFSATSNCGAVSYRYSITGATERSGTGNNASGNFNVGTSIITWVATDGAENESTCQTTVVVAANPVVSIADASVLPSGVQANTVYIGYTPASSLTLTATTTAGTQPYSYAWSNGGTNAATTVSPTTATTYTVTVKDANGCTASASKTVAVMDVRAGKKMDKVKVCHKPGKQMNILEIGADGVADHLGHGDMLGGCTDAALMVSNRSISNVDAFAKAELSLVANPNPSANHFVLKIEGAENKGLTLKVTDILGRVIEQKNNLQANRTLQIGTDYRPGVYFVELIQGTERKQIKLVKAAN
ncbi:MAG: T9SS type A sorting domain-containing protein, partial [Chitinophagaceae bacterium]